MYAKRTVENYILLLLKVLPKANKFGGGERLNSGVIRPKKRLISLLVGSYWP